MRTGIQMSDGCKDFRHLLFSLFNEKVACCDLAGLKAAFLLDAQATKSFNMSCTISVASRHRHSLPVTQLRGVRGKWRYASGKATVTKIAHFFSYNFLTNGKNKISFACF